MRATVLAALITLAAPLSAQQVPLGPSPQVVPAGDFGWLADGRRFRVGDIITVVVDEFTSASADRATSALEDRSSGAGVSVQAGTNGFDGTLRTLLGSESTQRGSDVREDRMASEVSVRVVAVEEGGTLRVEGRKMLVIDEHEQEVTVRGVIRPQDISSFNTVESWRLAESEILYAVDGSLGEADKSIIMRLLGWIL